MMIISIDSKFSFPITRISYYFSRDRVPILSNAQIASWPPFQPFRCIIGRLLHGKWLFSRTVSQASNSFASINARNGESLISISLDPGERLCVDLGHLVAVSEEIQFQTSFDLSLTSISAGRSFVCVSSGPGVIILSSDGQPSINLHNAVGSC